MNYHVICQKYSLDSLSGANLSGADLSGANLSGVDGIILPTYANRYLTYGWNNNGVLNIRAGCRNKTYSEAVKYWTDKPDRYEIWQLCHAIGHIAKMRGWRIE